MKNVKVKIRAADNGAGGVDFDIDGVKPHQARLKIKGGEGQHAIDFQLQDVSGRGLQFQAEDPIWVGENCPCPPASGINSDQITVSACNGKVLSTVNDNSGEARELRYQLNFRASDGSEHICDPIIDNGGSNRL